MKDTEQSLGEGFEKSKPIARRSSIILALLAGTALLAAACSAEAPIIPTVPSVPTKPEHPFLADGNYWSDRELDQSKDPFLKKVQFYFDPGYAGGSLAMVVCPNIASGEIRTISRQMNLNPGYLYNRPVDITLTCETFHPVTRVAPDENDQIQVGVRTFQEPYDNTYTGRAYSVTRQGMTQQIVVQPLGIQTLNPDSIIPRDPATARDYFKR